MLITILVSLIISGIVVYGWNRFNKPRRLRTEQFRFSPRTVCYIDTDQGTFGTFDDGDTWYKISKNHHSKISCDDLAHCLTEVYEDVLSTTKLKRGG